MQYAVCCVPVSAMRKEPLHAAEMVSQQLFGECCIILEVINNWINIRGKYDAYEGWCQASHLAKISEQQYSHEDKRLTAAHINKVKYNRQKMFVPFGSSLATFIKHKAIWQNDTCTYKGKTLLPPSGTITKKKIKWIAGKYLNTPYLWGGKSVFGVDCSGFTQSVYKFLNVYVPRDSWQQAEAGIIIDDLQQAGCGDLCFFNNEEGRIIHVGILLNHCQVIHSSGKVRIDEIDDKGIINSDTKQRTHSLKVIKRYFEPAH